MEYLQRTSLTFPVAIIISMMLFQFNTVAWRQSLTSLARGYSTVSAPHHRMRSTRNVALNMVMTDDDKLKVSIPSSRSNNFGDQVGAASFASAAAVAAAAVNAAVGMRPLSAPDASKTYVFKDGAAANRTGVVDEVGLPLVYDKTLIEAYWKKQGSALSRRWTEFLGYAVPYLTKVITILITGGSGELNANGATLARDARVIFEKLGPTYVKMGQMMSVRPDVLPPAALEELKILQDSVKPFDTATAIMQIESELGGPLGQFFSEISEEPVAAASLAQVYKAKLSSTGENVAIKVQRPSVLETVSKDLYVLRRAAEVYQGLIDRFAPQQRTNYVGLLNEWAVGFYTELDFLNEAFNQERLKELLIKENVTGVYIPKVYKDLSTRRVLVSEWVDGVKLSKCEPELLRELIPEAQEAFLTQLLQIGFFHADPHPGNIFYLNEPKGDARMALLDFGLVASVRQEDMDTMVSALIHLANKDYPSLVDDFIALEILPKDCDRGIVIPLMDKALTPYVKGGGAKQYEEELRKMYGMDGSISGTAGGFQQMTQDALTVLNDVPFSIPPYFALLGRAIVTLEGIALTGDPKYGIIMESYPFVARKLLKEDRPAIQRALQQVLYNKGSVDGLQATRLSVLLNSALGVVAKSSDAFVDFDSLPDEAISLKDSIKFLLGPSSASLRKILVEEAVLAGDILLRQASRKLYKRYIEALPRPPFLSNFLPRLEELNIPFLLPKPSLRLSSLQSSMDSIAASSGSAIDLVPSSERTPSLPLRQISSEFVTVVLTPTELLDISFPKLSREEEVYAISLGEVISQSAGEDLASIVNGNAFMSPSSFRRFVDFVVNTAGEPALEYLAKRQPNLQPIFQPTASFLKARTKSSNAKNDTVDEVLQSLKDLNDEEQGAFNTLTRTVVLGILEKLLVRAQQVTANDRVQ